MHRGRRTLHDDINIIRGLKKKNDVKMSAFSPWEFLAHLKGPSSLIVRACSGVCVRVYLHGDGKIIIITIRYDDDFIILCCIKFAFCFVTGLVHEATVGVGYIDRQHIVGADVFQTFDILDAAPVVDGLDTSRSHIT